MKDGTVRPVSLCVSHVSKSYGPLQVIDDLSLTFTGPGVYCLMAPSGAGKTTLFRLILGLETPDAGEIRFLANGRSAGPLFSAVFQEDRLIEHLSPVENLRLVAARSKSLSRDMLRAELARLLPEDSLDRPAAALSGGMRRRVAFLRAVLSPSDIVILDEPFTGLDRATRELAIRCLLEHRDGRLFLIATHDPEDVGRLGARLTDLSAIQTRSHTPAAAR